MPRRPRPKRAWSRPERHPISGSDHEGRACGGRSRTTAAMALDGDVVKSGGSGAVEEGAGFVVDGV